MKPKFIATILLLGFVGASVGYLVFKETRHPDAAKPQAVLSAEKEVLDAVASSSDKTTKPTAPPQGVDYSKAPLDEGARLAKTMGKSATQNAQKSQREVSDTKVVVYYFHGYTRCVTCRTIEAFARGAVDDGFSSELRKGGMEFRSINVEEPENEHFVQDYQLTTRSVVLVKYAGEKQKNWKNLDRVWELVRDADAFKQYVQRETKAFMEDG